MEGDCSTETTMAEAKCQSELVLVHATEASPKLRRKQRNRVKEKSKNKKVLFFAGFQMGEISQGVHLSDDKEDNTETHANLEKSKTEDMDDFDEEEVDDLVDYYEHFDYTNRKSSGKLSTSVSGSSKPKRGCPPGLMKVAEENKTSRRVWNVTKNCSAQKDNIDKKLEEKGIKKFGFDIYEKRAKTSTSKRKPRQCRCRKCHNSYIRHNQRRLKTKEDHPAALKYELKSGNIPQEGGAHLEKIVDLQHRDLTPEDYELLLMLDESVTPKTVSVNLLQSLSVLSAEAAEIVDELCSICMEVYYASQTVKKLPCAHVFHEQCIDMWLSNSSLNCPLDGLAVEVT